jgi:hypothetical protein
MSGHTFLVGAYYRSCTYIEQFGGENMENLEKKRNLWGKLQSLTIYFPQIAISVVLTAAIFGIGIMLYPTNHTPSSSNSIENVSRQTSNEVSKSATLDDIGKNYSNEARGLITTLFAIMTVTLALILILSVLFSSSPDYEKRFVLGKEVLTIFIGILGTIVGFYFGSAPIDNGSIKSPALTQEETEKTTKPLASTIYIQFFDESQRDKAKEFQAKLLENKFNVPGIENVGDDVGNKADSIKQNTVKYYNDADKVNAEKIQSLIDPAFVVQKGITKQKVTAGTIEVWFKTPV